MKKLAIIEDNPDNRILLDAILSGSYEIDEYEDGIEGLRGLKSDPPDLVLLDISLPEKDGPEVLREIRADPDLSSLPVIALTAHAMAGDRERFIEMGFDDYVSKPIIDEGLLVSSIERLLGE